ncbi:MAG: hypothetical protein ABJB55_02125 [Actinomycetota bacterium]
MSHGRAAERIRVRRAGQAAGIIDLGQPPNDTLTPSASWMPLNGTGTYQFRARLQRLGSSAGSGWSAAMSVSVAA